MRRLVRARVVGGMRAGVGWCEERRGGR